MWLPTLPPASSHASLPCLLFPMLPITSRPLYKLIPHLRRFGFLACPCMVGSYSPSQSLLWTPFFWCFRRSHSRSLYTQTSSDIIGYVFSYQLELCIYRITTICVHLVSDWLYDDTPIWLTDHQHRPQYLVLIKHWKKNGCRNTEETLPYLPFFFLLLLPPLLISFYIVSR